MTTEDLIARLRDTTALSDPLLTHEAADALEALGREIERLTQRLKMTTNLLSVIEQLVGALEEWERVDVIGREPHIHRESWKQLVQDRNIKHTAAIAAGQQAQEQTQAEVDPPVAWFAFADSNGPVPLELYGWDEKACKYAVLMNARSVGWKGTVEGYLLEQNWTIKPVYTHPQATEPAPNPWKDAVLNQLAAHCMDAPIDMPPDDILKRVIDMAVTMATDPAISEPAPKRPINCGTGHCSCIECVMEPAPSTDICRNCAGQGWEPSVYKGKVPCSFCQPAPSTAGERVSTLMALARAWYLANSTADALAASNALKQALTAALLQSTAGKMVPPEGYVMVPKELTPEMEAAYVDKAEEQDPFRTHWLNRHGYRAMIAAARSQPTTEESSVVVVAQPVREPMIDGKELWLWQNGDHMLAFEHLYPCFAPGGDPMTLGEPFGKAVFKVSHDRSNGITKKGTV